MSFLWSARKKYILSVPWCRRKNSRFLKHFVFPIFPALHPQQSKLCQTETVSLLVHILDIRLLFLLNEQFQLTQASSQKKPVERNHCFLAMSLLSKSERCEFFKILFVVCILLAFMFEPQVTFSQPTLIKKDWQNVPVSAFLKQFSESLHLRLLEQK